MNTDPITNIIISRKKTLIFQPIYSIIPPKRRILPDAEDFSFDAGLFHRIWRTAGLGGLPEERHASGAVHAYDETGVMEIVNLIFDPSRLSLPQLDGYSLPLFGKIFPDGKNLYHSANPAARLAPDDLIDIFHPRYIGIPERRDRGDRTRSGKLRFSPARFHF